MSGLIDMSERVSEPRELKEDELLELLGSVYDFCIPENKEAGEHAFNVMDYYEMEELAASVKKHFAELAALQARVAAVTSLVNEWRYVAGNQPMPTDKAIGMEKCADDLAAALDTRNP